MKEQTFYYGCWVLAAVNNQPWTSAEIVQIMEEYKTIT
jgi:hypothetical protein